MIMISFRTKKDKEHMLHKAKEMQMYVDDYVECLENSMSDDEYSERRPDMRMRDRYGRTEEYEPHYRMR